MIQPPYTNITLWIAIGFCIAQTGIFSGLNLAIFSVSRLRLEVEATGGNGDAAKLLRLRANSNFTLATILWGNVATNVLLTLSRSVLAGVGAFVFSTVVITFLGEIFPQAYFSRNAVSPCRPVFSLPQVLPGDFVRRRRTHGTVSQHVARAGKYRTASGAGLPRPSVEACGSRKYRCRTTGSHRRTKLSSASTISSRWKKGSPLTPAASSAFRSRADGRSCLHSNARRAMCSYGNLMLREESG